MSARAAARRRSVWVVGGLVVLLGAALGGVVTAFPAAAATTCPGCYGLERLRTGLYVERGISTRQQRHLDAGSPATTSSP